MRLGIDVSRRALAGAVFGMLAASASSVAAEPTEPVTLGSGNDPLVAVDDAGTAHFVWNRYQGDAGSEITYCRIPHGAGACEASQALAGDLGSVSAFDVLLRPSETGGMDVIILVNATGLPEHLRGTYSILSDDGGSSWAANHVSTAFAHDAQLAADRNYVELLGPTWFTQAPIAGPATAAGFDVQSGTDFSAAHLGRIPRTGTTIMTGISGGSSRDRSGATRFLASTEAGAGTDPAAWTAWRAQPASFLSWLVTGPGGAYLLAERASRSCTIRPLEIMRFDGTRLGPPSQLSYYRGGICELNPISPRRPRFSHATQDLAGRLQAVWVSLRDGCPVPQARCLIYRRGSRAGRPLGAPTVLRMDRQFSYYPRVAGGRDAGDVWVVWQSSSSSDSSVIAQRAFVSFESTLGDGTVRLLGPAQCVQPRRRRFRMRVVGDGVRVARVRFVATRAGGRSQLRPRRRTDRRSPFAVRLRMPRDHSLKTDLVTATVTPRGGGAPIKLYQHVSYGC